MAVARAAVQETGLDNAIVTKALALLASGRHRDKAIREALKHIVSELDNQYFAEKERYEAGEGSKDAFLDLFEKARAANAVFFAFEDDAFRAAAEATYEAGEPGFEVARTMLHHDAAIQNRHE